MNRCPLTWRNAEQAELLLSRLRVAECNDAIARASSACAKRTRGRSAGRGVADGARLKIAAILQFIRSGYRLDNVEHGGYLPAGGGPRWVLTNAIGVVEDGYLKGGWTTHVDITERKEAEQALKESEARYRQFLEMSVEGIWRLECDPPIAIDLEEQKQVELMLGADAGGGVQRGDGPPDWGSAWKTLSATP